MRLQPGLALLETENVVTRAGLAAAKDRPVAQVISAAAGAAENGAASTAKMLPQLGRSSHLGERVLGVPDPGAVAVAIWLRGLARSFAGSTS